MSLPNGLMVGGNYTFSDIKATSTDVKGSRLSKKKLSKGKLVTNKCKCNPKKRISGKENSPKGLGVCSKCTKIGVVLKGKDGNLWKNNAYKTGNRWIKITQ